MTHAELVLFEDPKKSPLLVLADEAGTLRAEDVRVSRHPDGIFAAGTAIRLGPPALFRVVPGSPIRIAILRDGIFADACESTVV